MRTLRKMCQMLLLVGAAFALPGCGDQVKVIDGSSEDKFRASLDAMKADLPTEEGADFESALAAVEREVRTNHFPGTVTYERTFRAKLDGKTGEEVLALGEELRAKAEREEQADVLISESRSAVIRRKFGMGLEKAKAALEIAPEYDEAARQVKECQRLVERFGAEPGF